MTQNHCIKRQILDINLDSDIGAFGLQSELSKIYYTEIVPMIDQFCTELSDPQRVYQIEKLEIALGNLDQNNLAFDLKNKIAESFPKELIKTLNAIHSDNEYDIFSAAYSNAKTDAENQSSDRKTKINPDLPASGNGERKHLESVQKGRDFDILLYYLKSGRLPWWSRKDQHINFVKFIESCFQDPKAAIDNLIWEITANPLLAKRFVYQFPDSIIEKLIESTQNKNKNRILSDRKEFHDVLIRCEALKGQHSELIRHEIWMIFLSNLLADQFHYPDKKTLIQIVSSWLSNAFKVEERQITDILSQWTGFGTSGSTVSETEVFQGTITVEQYLISLLNRISSLKSFTIRDAEMANSLDLSSQIQKLEVLFGKSINFIQNNGKSALINEDVKKHNLLLRKQLLLFRSKLLEILVFKDSVLDKIQTDQIAHLVNKIQEYQTLNQNEFNVSERENTISYRRKSFSEVEEIYISNAGLVLFWPYLAKLFNTFGYTEGNLFINQEKQVRAVFMLQYLVSGVQKYNEYEMPLNKLLCGIDPDFPIPAETLLIEKETSEADILVATLIDHWSVLKNMSPEGLRKMFLMREGMISMRDGNWVMNVEDQAYDILIDKMPWQIGTIKLPWMENIIFVEWRL